MGNEQEHREAMNSSAAVPSATAPPVYTNQPTGQLAIQMPEKAANSGKQTYDYDMPPGEFRVGLFSCCRNFGTCCCAMCCPICLFGRLAGRFYDTPEEAQKKFKNVFWLFIGGVTTFYIGIGFILLWGLAIYMTAGFYHMYQNAMREKGLKTTNFRDVLAVLYCDLCVACRLANESNMDDVCDCGKLKQVWNGEPVYRV